MLEFAHAFYWACLVLLGVHNLRLSKNIKFLKSLPAPNPVTKIIHTIETLTLPPAPGPTPAGPEVPPDFCINANDPSCLLAESFAPLPNRTNIIKRFYNVIQTLPCKKLPENPNIGRAVIALLFLVVVFLIVWDYLFWSRTRQLSKNKQCDNCISLTALNVEQQDSLDRLLAALDLLSEENGSLQKFRDLANGLGWELQQTEDQHDEATEDQKAEASVRLEQQKREFTQKRAELESKHQELLDKKRDCKEKVDKLRKDLQETQKQRDIWKARVNDQQPSNVIRDATTSVQLQKIQNQNFADRAADATRASTQEQQLKEKNARLKREKAMLTKQHNDTQEGLLKMQHEKHHFQVEVASRELQSETYEQILESIDQILIQNQRRQDTVDRLRALLPPGQVDLHPDDPFSRVETDQVNFDSDANDSDGVVTTFRVRLDSEANPIVVSRRQSTAVNQDDDLTHDDDNESDNEDAEDKPEDSKNANSDSEDDDDDNHGPGGAAGAASAQGPTDSTPQDNNKRTDDAPEDNTQPRDDGDMYDAPKSSVRTGTTTVKPASPPRPISPALPPASRIPRPSPPSTAPKVPANGNTNTSSVTATPATESVLVTNVADKITTFGPISNAASTSQNIASSGDDKNGKLPEPIKKTFVVPNDLARQDEVGLALPPLARTGEDLPEGYEIGRSDQGRVRQWNRKEIAHYNTQRRFREQLRRMDSKTVLRWVPSGPVHDGNQDHWLFFEVTENGQTRLTSYEDFLQEHNLLANANLFPPATAPRGPRRRPLNRNSTPLSPRTRPDHRPRRQTLVNPQLIASIPQSVFDSDSPVSGVESNGRFWK